MASMRKVSSGDNNEIEIKMQMQMKPIAQAFISCGLIQCELSLTRFEAARLNLRFIFGIFSRFLKKNSNR